jgi:hypothetical protein
MAAGSPSVNGMFANRPPPGERLMQTQNTICAVQPAQLVVSPLAANLSGLRSAGLLKR